MKIRFYVAAILATASLTSNANAETLQYAIAQAKNVDSEFNAVRQRFVDATTRSNQCSIIREARSVAQKKYNAWSRALTVANAESGSSSSISDSLRDFVKAAEDDMKLTSEVEDEVCS
jgi:hypothetical protein